MTRVGAAHRVTRDPTEASSNPIMQTAPARVHSSLRQVEAEVATAFGPIRTIRQAWSAPIDATAVSDQHWLQLSLLPASDGARGRFPDHWGPGRFERIGQVFMAPAGQILHAQSDCRSQLAICCAFDPQAIRAWLGEDLDWTDARLKGSLDLGNAMIRDLMLRVSEEIRRPRLGGEVVIELLAAQAAIELGRHFRAIGQDGPAGALAPWRLRRIDERLTEPGESPSLAELAGLVGLSVRQLARGYRAARGVSIGADVAMARIEQAKRFLASERSVKRVAFTLGFRSASSFTAAFRRATGQTPRAYQQGR